MFVVGLTGGIGSGKSAVAASFREFGIKVVDADQMSRQVVEPGMPALQTIAEKFGRDILLDDGSLNRARLREIIFSDRDAKLWLEALLHPLIREATARELQSASSPYAILESPLLLEMDQHREVDRVLVVDVPVNVQVARACLRDGNNEEQIRAIIAAQMPREEKLKLADDVIDNTCSLDELPNRVNELHHKYLYLAARLL